MLTKDFKIEVNSKGDKILLFVGKLAYLAQQPPKLVAIAYNEGGYKLFNVGLHSPLYAIVMPYTSQVDTVLQREFTWCSAYNRLIYVVWNVNKETSEELFAHIEEFNFLFKSLSEGEVALFWKNLWANTKILSKLGDVGSYLGGFCPEVHVEIMKRRLLNEA